jgi:hypothetical protein
VAGVCEPAAAHDAGTDRPTHRAGRARVFRGSPKEKQYLAIAQDLVKDGRGYLPNGKDVKYSNGGGTGKPPFRDNLDYLDRQITLLGTGGLLTMLTKSGSGTLAGNAHQEAFNQVAKADAVMVSEALQRDFDAPLLAAAFPGWPVEAGFEMELENGGRRTEDGGVASVAE